MKIRKCVNFSLYVSYYKWDPPLYHFFSYEVITFEIFELWKFENTSEIVSASWVVCAMFRNVSYSIYIDLCWLKSNFGKFRDFEKVLTFSDPVIKSSIFRTTIEKNYQNVSKHRIFMIQTPKTSLNEFLRCTRRFPKILENLNTI